MPRELRPVTPVILVLVVAAIVLDMVNGRFWTSDLRVYVGAADGLVHGTPVYGVSFGESTGFFKYAPLIAVAFVPAALLPFELVGVIHLLLEGLALAWTIHRLERVVMRHVFGIHVSPIAGRAWLLLVLTVVLLARELHLGNINLLLLALAVAAVDRTLENDSVGAGVFFGLLWLTKPYLAFMAVPLIAQVRWRILAIAGASIACGLLLPFMILGPAHAWQAHGDWLTAMRAHGSYLHSPDTLSSLLVRLTEHAMSPWMVAVFIGLTALILMVLMRSTALFMLDPEPHHGRISLGLFTALALVPNLVITDEEHFLYSTPLIAMALAGLFARWQPAQLALFSVAMLLYATRSSDLLGTELQVRTAAMGLLGIGNLLLILSAWLILYRALPRTPS